MEPHREFENLRRNALGEVAAASLEGDDREGHAEHRVQPKVAEDEVRQAPLDIRTDFVALLCVGPHDAMVLDAMARARDQYPKRGDSRIKRECRVVKESDR